MREKSVIVLKIQEWEFLVMIIFIIVFNIIVGLDLVRFWF